MPRRTRSKVILKDAPEPAVNAVAPAAVNRGSNPRAARCSSLAHNRVTNVALARCSAAYPRRRTARRATAAAPAAFPVFVALSSALTDSGRADRARSCLIRTHAALPGLGVSRFRHFEALQSHARGSQAPGVPGGFGRLPWAAPTPAGRCSNVSRRPGGSRCNGPELVLGECVGKDIDCASDPQVRISQPGPTIRCEEVVDQGRASLLWNQPLPDVVCASAPCSATASVKNVSPGGITTSGFSSLLPESRRGGVWLANFSLDGQLPESARARTWHRLSPEPGLDVRALGRGAAGDAYVIEFLGGRTTHAMRAWFATGSTAKRAPSSRRSKTSRTVGDGRQRRRVRHKNRILRRRRERPYQQRGQNPMMLRKTWTSRASTAKEGSCGISRSWGARSSSPTPTSPASMPSAIWSFY